MRWPVHTRDWSIITDREGGNQVDLQGGGNQVDLQGGEIRLIYRGWITNLFDLHKAVRSTFG